MLESNIFVILIFVNILFSTSAEATKCGAHQNNKAIIVHDIKSVQGKLSDCCGYCKSTPNCKAYTWSDWDGGTCVLKNDIEPVIDLPGVTIGILEPDTPPKSAKAVLPHPIIKSSKSSPAVSLFTNNNQISLDTPFSGHFTFYKKIGRGACGDQINAEKEKFAALSFSWFTKSKIMKDPLCNYCLEIDYNDKIITVPIKDRCPFCPRDQIYLSYKAFTSLQNPPDVGTVYGATFIIVQCED